MKTIALLLFFLIMGYISYSNEWEMTHNMYGDLPEAIEVPDSNNIFILTEPPSGKPYIYKSTDKGRTWDLISIIDLEFHDFEDMSCPDPKSIFVINTNGNIFKSLDSGKNFKLITFDEIEYIRSIEMFDEKIGVLDGGSFITIDGWETYKDFSIKKGESYFTYHSAVFVNDSIILSLAREYILSLPVEMQYQNSFILKLNINSQEYTLYPLDSVQSLEDCQKFKNGDLIICGKSNNLTGGSGRDAIYKSTDGGESWRRVLDLYTADSKLTGLVPFGLQSIAFNDEKTGIAVGQFGKIVYTYDGGESWIYENNLTRFNC
jgi:hypothetical protein